MSRLFSLAASEIVIGVCLCLCECVLALLLSRVDRTYVCEHSVYLLLNSINSLTQCSSMYGVRVI